MAEFLVILVSLALGSFANTIISYYLGESGMDIKRSKCSCGEKNLTISQLIPLLSFIISMGKCTYCRKALTFRYFLVEILFMVSGILSYLEFGISLLMAVNFICFSLLIIIAVIDYYRFVIPNCLVLLVLFSSVIRQIFFPSDILLGAAASLSVMVVFIMTNILMRKLKQKDAIGFGDIKLISALMILTGGTLGFIAIWISAFTAIPGFYLLRMTISRFADEQRVPFGMFISLGFIAAVLLEEEIFRTCFMMLGI